MSGYFKEGAFISERPLFGYTSPKKTKKECGNPAFYDKNLHRIGIFPKRYDDEGLPGYLVKHICVECGREFKVNAFYPSKKIENDGL